MSKQMSHMLDEIKEQPKWMERALLSNREIASQLAVAMREQDVRFVIIAARGTSDNAATYAKYLFEIVAGLPVALAAPSVYTLYDAKLSLRNTLVMGISQSGQGTDVNEVITAARAAGALTACITNHFESPLAKVSDYVLLCHAGEEKAVAATKTYTTALAAVALLVSLYTNDRELLNSLVSLPDSAVELLNGCDDIAQKVERYRYMSECAVIGRGVNQATALEAALKMTETSYVVAKPYSGADFLHGPVAMVHDGFPCFLFAPIGRSFPSMVELAIKLKERSAELVIFSSDSEILGLASTAIGTEVVVNELLSPLLAIIPGQLFAYYLSKTRGGNPDSPRGLSKVTKTT